MRVDGCASTLLDAHEQLAIFRARAFCAGCCVQAVMSARPGVTRFV